jgi:Tetratricopeptide repeat
MTKPLLPEPTRWSDDPDEPISATTAERAVGAALRRARDATEPSQMELHRLAIRRSIRPRSGAAYRIGRIAVAAALIVCMGGAVGAALLGWRYLGVTRLRSPASPHFQTDATPKARSSHGHRVKTASLDPPAPNSPVPPTVPASAAPRVVSSMQQAESSAAKPIGDKPSPTVTAPGEAAALTNVFRHLRSGGDASAALRLLDGYDRDFPAGTLQDEARIARAEALVALGRRMDALPLLEAIESSGGSPTRDLRIARAELLVEAGRCPSALGDFEAVLASTKKDDAAGRALYGRAFCRLRVGEIAAARGDLEQYVANFPDGASVAAARHALDSMR